MAISTTFSNANARAWLNTSLPGDVQVGAAVYLNTLIPAQIFARASGLDTARPSYYAVSLTRGLEVQLQRVTGGVSTALGRVRSADYVSQIWVRATLYVVGSSLRVQVYRLDRDLYLTAAGQWQSAPAWALNLTDTVLLGPGMAGLGRPPSYAGTLTFDDLVINLPGPVEASDPAIPRLTIPHHYPQIRIAELAYTGTPLGPTENQLLQKSVDLVVPASQYLKQIATVAPSTPQFVYTNLSNLYADSLADWLTYADLHGLPREGAFYHAATAEPFSGDSASSQPVNWFWSVFRGGSTLTDGTSRARGLRSGGLAFGGLGESVYLGYPDRFREINVNLASGASGGWSAVLEYATAVDVQGKPMDWAPLTTLSDTTQGLTQSGQITFDPPADWDAATVGGSARLFYVRVRTTVGGTAPLANTILGRDYVGANGSTKGTIPAFDVAADRNHDGYLDDAEYAHRAPGKDARFLYESRLFYGNYGQMRFAVNPADPGLRKWAVDYLNRLLSSQPLAAGLFVDNSGGRAPAKVADVLEPIASYTNDYAALLNTISRALAPRVVLANTSGGGTAGDEVIQSVPAYYEEFAIRALAHTYQQFEALAATVARRQALSPASDAVLDSLPTGGSPTDPRTQLATLAYYYLLADPNRTFLDFFGGYEPATSWSRHWSPAAAFNIGRPTGSWSLFATGADPANRSLTYRVYQRPYSNALVLYKPLSYANGVLGTLADGTATQFALGGTYSPLRADGTLGPAVTSVSLRNGEGAILVKTA